MAVLAFNDYIAHMDAEAHIDAPVSSQPLIALRQFALKSCRTLDRIHNAAEFGQQAVAHEFKNSTVTFGNLRLEQVLPVRPQAVKRVRLVHRHQPAVPDHIGGKYGGKLAFHDIPSPEVPIRSYALSRWAPREGHLDGPVVIQSDVGPEPAVNPVLVRRGGTSAILPVGRDAGLDGLLPGN
jgi:hypothetical protein